MWRQSYTSKNRKGLYDPSVAQILVLSMLKPIELKEAERELSVWDQGFVYSFNLLPRENRSVYSVESVSYPALPEVSPVFTPSG